MAVDVKYDKILGDLRENDAPSGTYVLAADKATGADIDTGTNDTKYVTPKAIADSKVAFESFVIAMAAAL